MRTQYLDFLKLKIEQDKLKSAEEHPTGERARIDFHLSFSKSHPGLFSNRSDEVALFTLDGEDIAYFVKKYKQLASIQLERDISNLTDDYAKTIKEIG